MDPENAAGHSNAQIYFAAQGFEYGDPAGRSCVLLSAETVGLPRLGGQINISDPLGSREDEITSVEGCWHECITHIRHTWEKAFESRLSELFLLDYPGLENHSEQHMLQNSRDGDFLGLPMGYIICGNDFAWLLPARAEDLAKEMHVEEYCRLRWEIIRILSPWYEDEELDAVSDKHLLNGTWYSASALVDLFTGKDVPSLGNH